MTLLYLSYWQTWFILSLVFFALEMAMPAALFLWPALASALVGCINLVYPLDGQINTLLASVISLVFAWFIRAHYLNRRVSDQPQLNHKLQQLLGQYGQTETGVDQHSGQVKLGDVYWSARCQTPARIAAGQQVKVVALQGTLLIVEPTESVLD